MSKGLFDARRHLAQIGPLLRQGNAINAVHSCYNGLHAMLCENLLKSERTEFENLLAQGVKAIAADKQVLNVFQMKLSYTPGQEKVLLENVRVLLDAMEGEAVDEAAKRFMEMEADKLRRLTDGANALEAGNIPHGKNLFSSLCKDHPTDAGLLVNMAEAYEKAGLCEDAAFLLEKAAALDPGAAYIHNKIGIVCRKLKRFDEAERSFDRAAAITPDDPYLYFNKGRASVDAQEWARALAAAQKALELAPDFNEAKMMAEYAKKRV